MEAVEVLAAGPPPPPPPSGRHKDLSPIAKGKRTKRLRHHSPIPFTFATPTHNTSTGNEDHHPHLGRSTATVSASSSSSEESTTTEEVDTARCLILLSRGQFPSSPPDLPNNNNNLGHSAANHHHPSRQAATAIYTCKTCNRSFPSFQALGGHRASHRKPKNEKRAAAAMFSDEEDFPSPPTFRNRISLNSLSLQLGNNASTATFSPTHMNKSSPSPRMHECSYCGAEFTSGQALGGHMRKHRAGPIIRSPEEVGPVDSRKPEINFGISLDLNLPAPEDDREKSPKKSNQRFRPGLGPHYYSTID